MMVKRHVCRADHAGEWEVADYNSPNIVNIEVIKWEHTTTQLIWAFGMFTSFTETCFCEIIYGMISVTISAAE